MDVSHVTGKHDADTIKRHIDKMARDWGVPFVEGIPVFITHDQGTNIVKAMKNDEKFASIPCMSHMLHNAVGHALVGCPQICQAFD